MRIRTGHLARMSTSLPTVERVNKLNYLDVVRKLDPELYLIRLALDEAGVNPSIIPQIIRAIGNLTLGEGYGKIQIFMQAKVITNIKPEENILMNETAIVENEERTEIR